MSVRLSPAVVNELLAAIDSLIEHGFQCGEETYEVALADLAAVKNKARSIKLELGYVRGEQAQNGRKRR